MGNNPSIVDVQINLNWDDFPEETEMLHGLIQKGTLSSFLYVVMQDIATGVYDLEESHKQQILDEIVETVSTIYNAMSGMDKNVENLIKTVNEITENPLLLQDNSKIMEIGNSDIFEDIDDVDIEPVEVDELDLGIGVEGSEDELDFTGMEDMFLP